MAEVAPFSEDFMVALTTLTAAVPALAALPAAVEGLVARIEALEAAAVGGGGG